MRLMREIRFSVGPELDGEPFNSWAGWPTATAIQPYVVMRATVEGTPDRKTGYLCNIQHIDRLLRDQVIPLFGQIARSAPNVTPESVVIAIAKMLSERSLPGTRWVGWQLWITPFLSYTVRAEDLNMAHITQCFEFSAAHRLHCPELSDAENRETFGKCNNPSGHGHNYQVEVSIAGKLEYGVLLPVAQFEKIVKERVIDRFDHKHLNEDCAEFRNLNPSVENITRTIWGLLDGRLAPAQLAKVRVWETPKTYAEYDGSEG